jgi:hypothetical protein
MSVFPPLINGTLREHYLLLFGAAGAVSVVVGAVSAWFGAQFGARRLMRDLRESQSLITGENAARLNELKQSLEDVGLEIERLAEGQRFTARVLVERSSAAPPAPPAPRRGPGEVTPH